MNNNCRTLHQPYLNFMKFSYRSLIFICLLVISFAVLPFIASAQIGPPDPDGDPDAPIDGGVGILVAAGVAYGVKRFRDERRKKGNDPVV